MANKDHLAILKKGVDSWNEWRRRNPYINPDLSEADLTRAKLSGADLRGAIFSRADFTGAIFSRADLTGARLSGADLSGANLKEVINLRQQQLEKAKIDLKTILPDYLRSK